ncbi:nucleotide-binding alpha-beta plait domain-containing protein [Tanacetum coccineum]
MAIGTGHRSNNYSESKRNDHLDNNRRQEQHNKGIPNKSHPNFREEHKSFSSIFVSNIPWNASVQDLWDICNKWGVVIDVYIAAKRSKSGHRFGFVRFINVNDINQLVSNLRTVWMGGFHLFADVAKYGRTYNRPVEGLFVGDGKPSVGFETLKFVRPGGCMPLGHHGLEVYKKLERGRWKEERLFTDMIDESLPLARDPDCVRGVESDLVDSFEEGEIRDDSVLGDCGVIRVVPATSVEFGVIMGIGKDAILLHNALIETIQRFEYDERCEEGTCVSYMLSSEKLVMIKK